MVSCVTLYFQFFYENNDLRANFISASFENDSTLVSAMVYYNKCNKYATVLGNELVVYQDSTDIEHKSFRFDEHHNLDRYSTHFAPVILSPGQQIHQDLHQFLDFRKINFAKLTLKPTARINFALAISYIGHNGLYSTSFITVGWVTLDVKQDINDFDFNYRSETLKSDTYYTGMSKRKN